MKKILCLFSASLLLFASCSSNDDNSSDLPSTSTLSILPKTVKFSSPSYPSDNSISTVTYNGNKIVSAKTGSERTDYVYDGNVIVKVTSYDTKSGKDVKSYEESYTYVDNKLATYYYVGNFTTQFPTGQYKGRSVYTYNSDGTVKAESYNIEPSTGVESKSSTTKVLTFVNGNLVKNVITETATGYYNIELYEYDSKNSPFKNITGFHLLINSSEFSSVNNIIKESYSNVSGTTTYGPDVYKKDFVYDANGFPTKQTTYEKDGKTVEEIIEYTY